MSGTTGTIGEDWHVIYTYDFPLQVIDGHQPWEVVWVAAPFSQVITVAIIEVDVVVVSLALSDCASWEVLATAFTVALVVLAIALVVLKACHSSTDSVFFAWLSS